MSTTSTLPDPFASPIKLGKYPRRTYKWRCSWMSWPSGQKREKYVGTPATDPKIRVAAAIARLIFMTRAECIALVDRHTRVIDKWIVEQTKGKADPAAASKEYWAGAEGYSWVCLPAWLARELDQVHGEAFIKEHVAAASLYFFGSSDHDEIRQWCRFVERRTTEAKAIDDAAHATLTAIMSAEGAAIA